MIEIFGQDLVGVRGSSPDFEALREGNGDSLYQTSGSSKDQVLVFGDGTQGMRDLDLSEIVEDIGPILTPETSSDTL